MSITKDIGRQYPLVARVDFTYASFGASGVAEEAIDLPVGAVVTGGALVITTAFNSATTDAIEVGDGDAVARFLASQDVKSAAGRFALTGTEKIYTAPDSVDLEWTGAGAAPSQGAGYLELEYVIDDRANENN